MASLRSRAPIAWQPLEACAGCEYPGTVNNRDLRAAAKKVKVAPVIQRPLLPVALLYLAGVLLGNFVPFPLGPFFLLTLAVAVAAFVWHQRRALLVPPLVLLAGAFNLTLHTAIVSPYDLRTIAGEAVQYVTVRGTLAGTPHHRSYDQNEEQPARTLAQVAVSALRRRHGDWQPAAGTVAVSMPGILSDEYFAGRMVEVTGILSPPRAPVAEGLFDYRAYLRHTGTYFQLRVPSPRDWHLIVSPGETVAPPVADRFAAWAKNMLALGLPEEDEPLRLLWTMTLGWKEALTGEVSLPFMKSGTMHIFAISGLHIALIAGILVAVLRVLRVSRGWCGLVVIPFIWFYTGVTGWQASAIRSTVMMTVVIAGWSIRRPSDLLNSLAAAALIILVWQPQQLFQASFQLSFFVVLSLALFTPVLDALRRRWLQPDPLLPDELRPRWQKRLRPAVFWLSTSFTTSLAAWLGSIPLVAWYFHLFTPVSLLANLMVVPLSSLALASNLAALQVGGWWPALAVLFNHSAWFFMAAMIRVSEWCASLPGSCFWIGVPSALGVATYYAVLIALMSGVLRRPRWRVWVATGLVLLCSATFARWRSHRAATRLTVLPLAGGSAVFFDAPGRAEDMLVDCGNALPAERVVIPYLHGRGVNRLPQLILTHGDLKYVGATELVQKEFDVGQIVTSPINFRSRPYREIVKRLAREPECWRQVVRGASVGTWKVLHPLAADDYSQADDAAMVLAGTFHGTRVLLLSDLGRPGQEALQTRETDLRADIVVTGMPEQTEPLGDGFLAAVKPKVIVVADSEYSATRRADGALRDRLRRHGIPVIYTRQSGAVTVTLRAEGWEARAMDGTKVEGSAK